VTPTINAAASTNIQPKLDDVVDIEFCVLPEDGEFGSPEGIKIIDTKNMYMTDLSKLADLANWYKDINIS
jgi:hypothetical protein